MKKILYSIALASIALGMTSCGKSKEQAIHEYLESTREETEEVDVPETANVNLVNGMATEGDLAEFIEFMPGEYQATTSGNSSSVELLIPAKVKKQSDLYIRETSEAMVAYDKEGNEIGKLTLFSNTDLSKLLNAGNTEDEVTVKFHYWKYDNKERADFMNNIATVKVVKVLGQEAPKEEKGSSSSNSSSDDVEADNTTSSGSYDKAAVKAFTETSDFKQFKENAKSGNIDKMLKAFDWYNAECKKLKPQVRALDKTAIAKSMELDDVYNTAGGSFTSLMSKLSDLQDQMTSSQKSAFDRACSNNVIYFNMKDMNSGLSTKYGDIVREIRMGL